MAPTIPATLRAELAKLNEEQIFELLSEILEPSFGGPFEISDELYELLSPIRDVYCAEHRGIRAYLDDEGGVECLCCGRDCNGRCDILTDMRMEARAVAA